MVTDSDRNQTDVSVRFVRWEVLNMFKTSHRMEQTSTDKERIHRIRNRHQTNTNGHKQLKKNLFVTHPLARCDRNLSNLHCAHFNARLICVKKNPNNFHLIIVLATQLHFEQTKHAPRGDLDQYWKAASLITVDGVRQIDRALVLSYHVAAHATRTRQLV